MLRQQQQFELHHQSLSFFMLHAFAFNPLWPPPPLTPNQRFHTGTVRLKWTHEPPSEVQVRAGKALHLECDASGQPTPLISWTSLKGELKLLLAQLFATSIDAAKRAKRPIRFALYVCATTFLYTPTNRQTNQLCVFIFSTLKLMMLMLICSQFRKPSAIVSRKNSAFHKK